jgi:predicted nucleic acid-binding protein
MAKILIDTRIWVLSIKFPYITEQHKDYDISLRAKTFVEKTIKDKNIILVSNQLVTEIFHVLVNRGIRIPSDHAKTYVSSIVKHKKTNFKGATKEILLKAIEFSSSSGIHIWDYLVVLPFKNSIDLIVTMDPHFQHPTLNSFASIKNPVDVWKVEGAD